MPRFDLKRVLKAVQKEKAALFPGVPRLYVSINESPETRSTTCARSRHALGARRCPRGGGEVRADHGGNLVEGTGSPRHRR
jgi:long-chain acyl-CoA synthetase